MTDGTIIKISFELILRKGDFCSIYTLDAPEKKKTDADFFYKLVNIEK